MHMSPTFTPHILTIKIFSAGPAKASTQDIADHMMQFGTLVDVSVTPMKFDGMSLVPAAAPAAAAPIESAPAKKIVTKAAPITAKAPKAKKDAKEPTTGPKVISFAPGSDPERIWHLIQNSYGITSSQIREQLELGSNIVNTTIYRLKNAGMAKVLDAPGASGDMQYTSTEWEQEREVEEEEPVTTAKPEHLDINAAMSEFAKGLGDDSGLI